jgi:hypothetical protein
MIIKLNLKLSNRNKKLSNTKLLLKNKLRWKLIKQMQENKRKKKNKRKYTMIVRMSGKKD